MTQPGNNRRALHWALRNWQLLLVLLGVVVSYLHLNWRVELLEENTVAGARLGLVEKAVEKNADWIDTWERTGELYLDVEQNGLLKGLRVDVNDLDTWRDKMRDWQLGVERRMAGVNGERHRG